MLVGSIVEESYEILEPIGDGGTSSVFRARELGLDRIVALKFLRTDLIDDIEWRKRFLREGKILAALKHPNILQCYRLGVCSAAGASETAGLPYIAMEYLQGSTLQQVLNEQGPLSVERVLNLVLQICAGMEAAHNQEIVHRDLKPANIMLVNQGDQPDFVKIVDFGLAHVERIDTQNLTLTGELLGSVHYMSPEQCKGQRADARSDLYAIGCLLYEMITQRPPFDAENPIAMMHLHTNELPTPPHELIKSLPEGLSIVILKLLEKAAARRYQNVSELVHDLHLVRNNRGAEISADSITYRKRKPKRWQQVCTCAIIAGVTVIASVTILGKSRSKEEPALKSKPSLSITKALPSMLQMRFLYPRTEDRIEFFSQWLAKNGNARPAITGEAYYLLARDLAETLPLNSPRVVEATTKSLTLLRSALNSDTSKGPVSMEYCTAVKHQADIEDWFENQPEVGKATLNGAIVKWRQRIDPAQETDLILRIADIDRRHNNWAAENRDFLRCLEVTRKAPSHLEEFILTKYVDRLITNGRTTDTARYLKRLIVLTDENPQCTSHTLDAAHMAQRIGDYELSMKLCNKATCQSEMERRQFCEQMALSLQGLKKYKQAHEYWLRTLLYTPKEDKWLTLVSLLSNASHDSCSAEAAPVLDRQIAQYADNQPELLLHLYDLAVRLEAEKCTHFSHPILIKCAQLQDKLPTCCVFPKRASMPLILRELEQAGDHDLSERLIRKALPVIPLSEPDLRRSLTCYLIRTLLVRKAFSESLSLTNEIIQQLPADVDVHDRMHFLILKTDSFIGLHKLVEARETLNGLNEMIPQCPAMKPAVEERWAELRLRQHTRAVIKQ